MAKKERTLHILDVSEAAKDLQKEVLHHLSSVLRTVEQHGVDEVEQDSRDRTVCAIKAAFPEPDGVPLWQTLIVTTEIVHASLSIMHKGTGIGKAVLIGMIFELLTEIMERQNEERIRKETH